MNSSTSIWYCWCILPSHIFHFSALLFSFRLIFFFHFLFKPIAYYSLYSINTTMLKRKENKRMHSPNLNACYDADFEIGSLLVFSANKKKKKTKIRQSEDPIHRIQWRAATEHTQNKYILKLIGSNELSSLKSVTLRYKYRFCGMLQKKLSTFPSFI